MSGWMDVWLNSVSCIKSFVLTAGLGLIYFWLLAGCLAGWLDRWTDDGLLTGWIAGWMQIFKQC